MWSNFDNNQQSDGASQEPDQNDWTNGFNELEDDKRSADKDNN